MNRPDIDQILTKYADLMVKVGLNIQPGQRLVIRVTNLDAAPFVRKIAEAAYKQGSALVHILWQDEYVDKIRYQYAPKDSFEEFPEWTLGGVHSSILSGDAYLQVGGHSPTLMNDADPELKNLAVQMFSKNNTPIGIEQGKDAVQWSIAYPPTPGWASSVFPDDTPEEALNKLWDAVIKACRLDLDDPIAFWQQQRKDLLSRSKYLNDKQYTELQFRGSGTDLKVGLPEGHIWIGGGSESQGGVDFIANVPTEEVYTLPHREKVNGHVTATKPLNYQGSLIENFQMTFSEGKVVEFSAEKGEATLDGILETDENARYIGEVALVPYHTPISKLGLVFKHTLYDENASHHVALGRGYKTSLTGGADMTDEEFLAVGGNTSQVHVDFMFGSETMEVDGVLPDGTVEPLIRDGDWVFEV